MRTGHVEAESQENLKRLRAVKQVFRMSSLFSLDTVCGSRKAEPTHREFIVNQTDKTVTDSGIVCTFLLFQN